MEFADTLEQSGMPSWDYTERVDRVDQRRVTPAGRGRTAGADVLSARTPFRHRSRVLDQFRSQQNIAYLRNLLATRIPRGLSPRLWEFAQKTLEDAVFNFEQAEDLVYSDPLAQRGDLRRGTNFWDEVRRLNRAFYESRLAFITDKAALIEGYKYGVGSGGPGEDSDEPYHMQMFIADSLRPPGLEHFNPGPLYGIEEDRTASTTRPYASYSAAGPHESFSGPQPDTDTSQPTPGVDPGDWAWDRGDPNRTPEQALAEYWGEGVTESTMLGSKEVGGRAYGDHYAWGDRWQENGGTRFMRYESVPFWQNLSRGRDGYDYDIEETLGTGSRELDGQVRGWDMSRVRNPRGEEYSRYGPRSGYVV